MITWKEVEQHWPEFKNKVHSKWEKIPNTDLDRMTGKKEQLVHAIEERYHVNETEATRQVDTFLKAAPPFKR